MLTKELPQRVERLRDQLQPGRLTGAARDNKALLEYINPKHLAEQLNALRPRIAIRGARADGRPPVLDDVLGRVTPPPPPLPLPHTASGHGEQATIAPAWSQFKVTVEDVMYESLRREKDSLINTLTTLDGVGLMQLILQATPTAPSGSRVELEPRSVASARLAD